MSEPNLSTLEIRARIVRPGSGSREFSLPEGATLADLLRQSGSSWPNQAAFIDGIAAEETRTLHDGVVVTIGTRRDEPWRDSIPAFQDEALFDEYVETVNARRREIGPEEDDRA